MATTRNGKTGPTSPVVAVKKSEKATTPAKPKAEPKTKAGMKRKRPEKSPEKEKVEEKNAPLPKKRGRPPKATREQKTIEKTIENGETKDDKVEDKKEVEGEEKTEENSEETVNSGDEKKDGEEVNDESKDIEMSEAPTEGKTEDGKDGQTDDKNGEAKYSTVDNKEPSTSAEKKAKSQAAVKKQGPEQKNAFDEIKSDEADTKAAAKSEQDDKSANISANDSVIEDSARSAAIPSSILEKGIIYFFFRGRVNIEDPEGIEDIARSYIVLRPLPLGAKIEEGPMQDDGKARLLALPKKMLPKSRRDRFLMFVEKTGMSIEEVREQFAGNEYATKTAGTRNIPAATPSAEGIYAITSTGRESHLAYHVTVPKEIGEVQKGLGINSKGSFVVSTKNPEAPGPANATFSNPAKYPEDVQKKFGGLRWMPTEPEHFDYEATQFLVIGEGMGELGRAVEEMGKDKKDGEKEKPVEEIEKLEEEDHARVEGLKEDDPVFADLGLSSKEYHHLQTTW